MRATELYMERHGEKYITYANTAFFSELSNSGTFSSSTPVFSASPFAKQIISKLNWGRDESGWKESEYLDISESETAIRQSGIPLEISSKVYSHRIFMHPQDDDKRPERESRRIDADTAT